MYSVDSRERLVAATQELLWQRGYAATSPKDIQRAAGAGQGSMYHHFSGKQELAVSALEQSAQLMRHEVQELLEAPGTAVERVERYLLRQRDSLRGCRIGRMTFDPEAYASEEILAPVGATLGWTVDQLAAVIRSGVEAGELAESIDPAELAATIVAVVQGGYVLARAQRSTAPFEAATKGAVVLLQAATYTSHDQ